MWFILAVRLFTTTANFALCRIRLFLYLWGRGYAELLDALKRSQ
jgi:hypothetical protein